MSLALANSQQHLMQTEDDDLTPEELAELKGEFAVVKSKLPKWRFNGAAGIYVDQVAFKADRDPDRHARMLRGVILGFTYSQGLNSTDEEIESKTYTESWLCYAPNKLNPPRLNPELPEDQVVRVKARGAGVKCGTCPLSKFNEDLGKAECSAGIRLLFRIMADELQAARTVVLSFSGYSVKALNTFIDQTFKQRDRPTLASIVAMGRRPDSREVNGKVQDFWVATFEDAEEVPRNQWRPLMDLRKAVINGFEQPDDIHDELTRDDRPARSSEVTAEDAPPPESAGFTLNPDGTPNFGEVPANAKWGDPGTPEHVAPPPTDKDLF